MEGANPIDRVARVDLVERREGVHESGVDAVDKRAENVDVRERSEAHGEVCGLECVCVCVCACKLLARVCVG
jgi:hypothetical protein